MTLYRKRNMFWIRLKPVFPKLAPRLFFFLFFSDALMLLSVI